jgi:hypothetical protein
MIAAEWEVVLGVWLLSGIYRVGSWLFGVGTFATFACISGYLGWVGHADCGCLGAIKASPWHAFGVDIAVVVLLAVARPDAEAICQFLRGSNRVALVRRVGFVAIFASLTALAIAGGTIAYGSHQAALARLRGDAIVIEPGILDLDVLEKDQSFDAAVTVKNWTDKPVRVIGGTSDCSCVATLDLPVVIEPGHEKAIAVRVVAKANEPGVITRWVLLWTDDDQQRVLPFGITFRVR